MLCRWPYDIHSESASTRKCLQKRYHFYPVSMGGWVALCGVKQAQHDQKKRWCRDGMTLSIRSIEI